MHCTMTTRAAGWHPGSIGVLGQSACGMRAGAAVLSKMARPLTDSDLIEIETRLIAALQIITPPWEMLLETGGYALGGGSFIRGADPEDDQEIYA
jgi:hypothetical protein